MVCKQEHIYLLNDHKQFNKKKHVKFLWTKDLHKLNMRSWRFLHFIKQSIFLINDTTLVKFHTFFFISKYNKDLTIRHVL